MKKKDQLFEKASSVSLPFIFNPGYNAFMRKRNKSLEQCFKVKTVDFQELQEEAVEVHRLHRGKLAVSSKVPLQTRKDLSLLYTPGVGAVSKVVAEKPEEAWNLTMKGNSVAVVSDGSAVLGLGNLGPEGALPVMEGKCLIFKKFGGLDAFPIVLATQDSEEIIRVVEAIAPTFGGINLEDISAPRCFEIEERLKNELTIPVMHDDQHGTAMVVLAALLNALRVVEKKISEIKIVVSGAGPAGVATVKLLLKAGARKIIVLDSKGIISKERVGLESYKEELAKVTNQEQLSGSLAEAVKGADVFIGVSRSNTLFPLHIQAMAKRSIIFALANPVPEIMPELAYQSGAAVVATGRSDFPNQINNSLVFPGVFRGALDQRVSRITEEMKIKVSHALANLIKQPTPEEIIPSMFNPEVVKVVAAAIQD